MTALDLHSARGPSRVELRAEGGSWIAAAVAAACPGRRLFLLTDAHVAPLHAAGLTAALTRLGKTVVPHVVAPGEATKSLAGAASVYAALAAAALDRQDALLALGGGMVGDLGGFCASTYLRGIACVQVPTSTLAALDASVGGKTGLNLPAGKNLVGTFQPPRLVLISVALLASQPRRAHAAGLVEAYKIAACLDAELFARLQAEATANLAFGPTLLPALHRAIELKAAVVGRDPLETGERAVLNFGHTLGHPLETAGQPDLLHGEAVALGMLAETTWAQGPGGPAAHRPPLAAQLQAALAPLQVPLDWQARPFAHAALALDKKRAGASLVLPVLAELGAARLEQVALADLVAFAAHIWR